MTDGGFRNRRVKIVQAPESVEKGMMDIFALCEEASVPFAAAQKMVEQIQAGLKGVDAIGIVASLLRARGGVADEAALKREIEAKAEASLGGSRPQFESFLDVEGVRDWARARERKLDKRLRDMRDEKRAIERELSILARLERVFRPVDDDVDRMGRKKVDCEWPGCDFRATPQGMSRHRKKHMKEAKAS